MASELTNLIPSENSKAFKREYFMRLSTVAVCALIGLLLVQGALLLPSYLYERVIVANETTHLQSLSANLATTQEQQVQARLTALQTESTHLLGLASTSEASTLLQAILAVPRPGITLNGFTFTPLQGQTPGNMQVTGTADTREDLRSFDTALGALPFVSSADLPIGDYAKDTEIPFTITLTGPLLAP